MAVSLFTKLHRKITTSSIWDESHATRIVWITMLAMVDEDGHVMASPKALARHANVTTEELAAALKVLEGPDVNSSSPDEDGRRAMKVSGGWFIVNYAQYRDRETDRKKQNAERQREFRKRQKGELQGDSEDRNVTRNARNVTRNAVSQAERDNSPEVDTDTEVDTEAEVELTPPAPQSKAPTPESLGVAQYLYDAIKEHSPQFLADAKPKAIAKKLEGWARDIDRAMRIDGMTTQGARDAIDVAHRGPGDFWHKNILSGAKLRKHYERLRITDRGKGQRSNVPVLDDAKIDAMAELFR